MVNLQFDRERVMAAVEAVTAQTMRMDLTWDWPCGVAYYGMCEISRVTGEDRYIAMVRDRVEEHIALGLPIWTVNTCAMGHCLLSLYEKYGDERYKEIALSKLDYLRHRAERFGEGTLQHTVSAKNDFPEQCWADTLMMGAYFMLRAGVLFDDAALVEDALRQYVWHIEYLQDRKSGLWYHGYSHISRDHLSGFHWGRANAWAAYTMSQVSRVLPECYLYPGYMDVAGSLAEQLSALKLLQTEGGLWRTILDDEASYEEVSASCGIAAAMAAAGNPLHRKYVERAIAGVLDNISPEGRVLNVSGGTAVMKDRDGYRNISRRWTQGWGQGLALAFLAKILETA